MKLLCTVILAFGLLSSAAVLAQVTNPPTTQGTVTTSLTGAEQVPIQGNGATQAFTTVSSLRDGRDYIYQVPVTGFSIVMGKDQSAVSLNPAGTLAAGSVVLPPIVTDGKTVSFFSSQNVTAFALSTSTGSAIINPVTSLAANAPAIGFVFDAPLNAWVRHQ